MDSIGFWIAGGAVWLVCAATSAFVAAEKGRAAFEGAVLVFFFGPLGLILATLLPPMGFRENPSPWRVDRPGLDDDRA